MKKRSAQRTKRRSGRSKNYNKHLYKNAGLFAIFSLSLLSLIGLITYKNNTKTLTSAISPLELLTASSELSTQELTTVMVVVIEDLNVSPVITNSIMVSFLDRDTKKVLTFEIPVDLQLDIPGKLGEETISKVIALGAMQNNGNLDSGIELMHESLVKILGYKIDRFVISSKEFGPDINLLLTAGELTPALKSNYSEVFKSLKTDLNIKEIYELYKFINSLPSERFNKIIINEELLVNSSVIDENIKDFTFDSVLAQEKKSIAILNGANKKGVASYGSRILENMGGRIVAVENALEIYDESILVVDDLNSSTVREIQNFFGFKNVILRNSANINENALDRANITLIIGIDIANAL